MTDFLPYGHQLIEDDDVAAVVDVLGSDFLTTGPAVEAFETALAAAVGARHAVVCSSGTAALHLAAMALRLGPDDAVVVPTLTFLATASSVRYVGAEVVFADVDPETGLMRPDDLTAALARPAGDKATAVFPVCYAGQSPDREAMAAAADGRSLVYDSSHALGTTLGGDGRVGDVKGAAMETFSFHPVKTIAMGEGGAVTTNDDALAVRLRRLRNHGMVHDADDFTARDQAFAPDGRPNPWYHELQELGLNYRASDIHCALALSQLRKLDRFSAARRALVAHYDALLALHAPGLRPLGRVPGCEPAWHLYVALIDFASLDRSRADVMAGLRAKGIGTQVHYIPVHRQPYYRERYPDVSLPGADAFYQRALTLPLSAGMTENDVERVVAALIGELGLG